MFRSARQAQVWFELRRTVGTVLPFVIALIFVMPLMLWALAAVGDEDASIRVLRYSLVIIPAIAVSVAISSMFGSKMEGEWVRLSTYESTQPISVVESVRLKAAVAVGIGLVTLLVLGIESVFCTALVTDGGFGQSLKTLLGYDDAPHARILSIAGLGLPNAIVLYATLALLHLNCCYSLACYPRYLASHWKLTVCLFSSLALQPLQELTGWNIGIATDMCMTAWGVFLVSATVRSLHRALGSGYFSGRKLTAIIAGWVVLLIVSMPLAPDIGLEIHGSGMGEAILLFGLFCIPVASIAWAPLSLAAARHQ